ncbi:acyltransferase family protein [Kocuria sp. M1R5S2]|uniref:acyltransferase family protein n=1 Tax=Kocuria rhizosphaerae TaxID=3376285 RepID=UPI0037A4CA47
MSLKERLGTRHNRLNMIRLILASLVILGHAWPLTGTERTSLEFLADVAVNGFFVLSGYLIAESRVRTKFVPYLWRRLLRIYPAFVVSLLAVAFVFAPLAGMIDGSSLNVASAVGFVLGNSDLKISQWGIEGSLTNIPYAGAWNGSLWTLFYEAVAYVAIGLVLSLAVAVRHARWVLPSLFLAVLVFRPLALGPLDVTTNLYLNGLRLAGYFLVGAAIWAWASKWRPTGAQVAVAGLVYTALLATGWADLYGQLPLAVLLLGLGAAPSSDWTTRTDLSYGVYIYAFPVQQILVLLGTASWGVAANSVLVLLLTLPLALMSWKLVEKPALKAKAWLDPRHRPDKRISAAGAETALPTGAGARHRA